MPNFTTEDLLVYLYSEMEPEQAHELETALQSDWALHEKYQVLREAHTTLNTYSLSSPRSVSISKILGYAEASLHFSN